MQRTTYIRPIGLVARRGDDGAEPAGMPLAEGVFDFSGYEVLRREPDGHVSRMSTSLGDLFERDWTREADALSIEIQRIGEPRARVAGLDLARPRIMGIVNVTPDSFSDGGSQAASAAAIAHALRLVAEGADLIDIGGESTRPGAEAVPVPEELARVMPVIAGVRAHSSVPISIDTRKADVMRQAVAAGADIINDVSALTFDPAALGAAVDLQRPVVLMHAQGDPKTMQDAPRYASAPLDVFDWLADRVETCVAAGLPRRLLIVDPGIGFGKTTTHNLELMACLSLFHALGTPVLVGASRKRFIGEITGATVPAERVAGSLGAALAAAAQGVQILRVHDVAATRAALDVWHAATAGSFTRTSGQAP